MKLGMNKDGIILLFIVVFLSFTNSLNAQISFHDISEQSGIKTGGENIGVAFGDYDNDGDEDLYVSVRNGRNKLFQNIDGSNFINVAELAGVDYEGSSRTSIWLDVNNDGLLDLYVSNFNEIDQLYINQGDGTFSEDTRLARIYNPGRTFSVNAADVNQDGFIDIYVANFKEENKLFINNGDGTFSNKIDELGPKSTLNAMGVIFFDYDKDNDSDLYLVHDGQPNILYKNTGGGRYVDVSELAGVNDDGFGMGVDVGDLNRDGWLDIYVTNLYENTLYLNNGDGTFSNLSEKAGVEDYGMGWGTNFLDFNNDGLQDIYVANDSYFSDYPNVLYKNMGDSTFTEMTNEYEVCSRMAGYGSAVADINRDGFVDLVVANAGRQDYLQLFTNQSKEGNWIGFQLEGVRSNPAAVGARVELIDENGVLHVDEVNAGSGYASMNSLILHFGLGEANGIQSGTIVWPRGPRQQIESLEQGHYYKIVEGEAPVLLEQTVTNTTETSSVVEKAIVSPNPARDVVQLELELKEPSELLIGMVNQNGQLVRPLSREEFVQGTNSLSIFIPSRIPNGVYQVLVVGKTGVRSLPLVIAR
jgi:hypothetical protein